jgi:hypothetical protein
MHTEQMIIENHSTFARWLYSADAKLASVFDFKKRTYNKLEVDNILSTASQSEVWFMRFALGVWHGKNKYNFDLIDAAPVLDTGHYRAIIQWIEKPVWA